MPLGIVPKIPCQHIFEVSDTGVPRTFVLDCRICIQHFSFEDLRLGFTSV